MAWPNAREAIHPRDTLKRMPGDTLPSKGRDLRLLRKPPLIRNTIHLLILTRLLPTLLTTDLPCTMMVTIIISNKDSKEDLLEALRVLLLDTTSNEDTTDVHLR